MSESSEGGQKSKVALKTLLCVAIPTFNRASRLEQSLADLLNQIIKSEKQHFLSVFVSNNGSTDATAEVINKYSEIFKQNKIPFSSQAFPDNRGFDANVLNCYKNCEADYIWFLSDDDNVADDSISSIIDDIQTNTPSVLYYNFDQDPYNLENPYIKEKVLYDYVDANNIDAISKIIFWPKLTSLVIKKIDGQAGEKIVRACGYGFIHTALAIQTALDHGRVLHSAKYIARPDDGYMDQIDFPPYIGNFSEKTVRFILHLNNRMDIYHCLTFHRTNPLTSSMNTLATYYRGRIALTPELKSELYSTVIHELKNMKITEVKIIDLTLHIIRLFVGYVYNIGSVIITGKRATKLRMKNKTF